MNRKKSLVGVVFFCAWPGSRAKTGDTNRNSKSQQRRVNIKNKLECERKGKTLDQKDAGLSDPDPNLSACSCRLRV